MTRKEWKAEVKKQMTLHDMRIRDVAEATGYSYSHVSNALNGGIASRKLFEMVSACFGIEPPTE